MFRRYFLAVLISLFILNLTAQDMVEFKTEIRARSEFDNKDFNSDNDYNNFTDLRTRLGVLFTPDENLSAFVQLQDSRRFGTEPSTISNTFNIDLHQAFFEVKNLFNLPVDLKAGRMEANYGPQRLIGQVNWNNIGRSFDGAYLKFNFPNFTFDIFDYKISENSNVGDTLDQNFMGIYGNAKLSPNYIFQPFVFWEKNIPKETLSRVTLGAYVKGNVGNLFHETEFTYQTGNITNAGREQDVNALMAALNVGYKIGGKLNPTIIFGIDYLSGDDNTADNEYKSFNTLYASNHKYYGLIDYFNNIPLNTMNLGLTDIFTKLSASFSEKLEFAAEAHIMNSSEKYILLNGNSTNNFGTEIDFTFDYSYNKYLKFQGGFCLFSPGDILKEVEGPDTSTWVYLLALFSM